MGNLAAAGNLGGADDMSHTCSSTDGSVSRNIENWMLYIHAMLLTIAHLIICCGLTGKLRARALT